MKTILIIHANPIVRRNLATVLELEGYAVLTAENGSQGLQTTQTAIPDLILCDAAMPGIDCHAVLDAIRKEPSTSSVPFLMVTTKSQTSASTDPLTQSMDQEALLDSPLSVLKMIAPQ